MNSAALVARWQNCLGLGAGERDSFTPELRKSRYGTDLGNFEHFFRNAAGLVWIQVIRLQFPWAAPFAFPANLWELWQFRCGDGSRGFRPSVQSDCRFSVRNDVSIHVAVCSG